MIDTELFRKTMRQWAAGVTVITLEEATQIHGMTANSFTSVSCSPPLVLFCVGLTNDTHKLLQIGSTIGINLLSESQLDLSMRFAAKKTDRYRFDDLKLYRGSNGALLFPDCAAVMEATILQAHAAGDHSIFISQLLSAVSDNAKNPLVYSQGRYARLSSIPLEPIEPILCNQSVCESLRLRA
jgi:flavin reductase